MTTIQRALDAVLRAENRRAVEDNRRHSLEALLDECYAQSKYPPGTPEYDAYVTKMREELAKWVAGVGEYAYSARSEWIEKTGDSEDADSGEDRDRQHQGCL